MGVLSTVTYDQDMLDQPAARDSTVELRSLTRRELEVLEVIASGMTNAEAANLLHLSVHAVKFHLAAIYRRLGVTNRTEAAVAYLRAMSTVRTD
jgi:DNA-binding NarL/FixJ family response regulator